MTKPYYLFILVATMYIDTSTTHLNGKTYARYLLRESYREDGKVKHRTIANLSACSPEEISAMKLALSHKHNIKNLSEQLSTRKLSIQSKQGLSVGGVWLLKSLAKEIGLEKILGETREGKLALWQIIARAIDQGSRLSSVRLAASHAACDTLNLAAFDEDDLYKNVEWLCENQKQIEEMLYRLLPEEEMKLLLYDVTSSYFEGTCNELSAYGYNRDGKRGKEQIVIGLLCNSEGTPITVQVFEGNTQDPKTLTEQLRETAKRFELKNVIWVGDRGMIKKSQIEQITEAGFHYITAITKPQIKTLCKNEVIQMDLFDNEITEVTDTEENIRYILRRNPVREAEIKASRESKWAKLQKLVNEKNAYLKEHKKAKTETALEVVKQKAAKLKASSWSIIEAGDRSIQLRRDEEAIKKEVELDGCYVIKSDVAECEMTKEMLHRSYKELAMVEQAFRTSKTAHLELRPIYVRNAERTRGHVFVVMLAYRLIKELKKRWENLEITVEEGLASLSTLTSIEVIINKGAPINQIPIPNEMNQELLKAAKVKLPRVLASKGEIVATRKKLVSERKIQ